MRVGNWDMWTERYWLHVGDIHTVDSLKVDMVTRGHYGLVTENGLRWPIWIRMTGGGEVELNCLDEEEQLRGFRAIRDFIVLGRGIAMGDREELR